MQPRVGRCGRRTVDLNVVGGGGRPLTPRRCRRRRRRAQEELQACHAAYTVPMGRLQESMSLSSAVPVVLADLFRVGCHSTNAKSPTKNP